MGRARRAARWAALLLALPLLLVPSAAAGQERQQRRVAPQRSPARTDQVPDETAAARLVDRFGERVGQALRLDRGQTQRLTQVLQQSRRERTGLEARRRQVVQELAQLVRAGSPDEDRVGVLLEELLRLRVRQAEVDLEENRRLSEFLGPLQRARLFHLKQRLAERALEARRGREDVQRP